MSSNTGSASAAVVETQERLKRAQLENQLESQLRERPSLGEMESSKMLMFAETVEVLPTFRKSEYNRKPDGGATFRNLTPLLKGQIRDELNTYKKNEMEIHDESTLLITQVPLTPASIRN